MLDPKHAPHPASFYPSPLSDRQNSPLAYNQKAPQVVAYNPAMAPPPTDEDLENLEEDPDEEGGEARPRKAPPLPLEHIYVHDANYPLRLTDFEIVETLG